MKAEIIAVGSELLTPDRMDTNSLYLTEELNKLGIEVVRKTIVGDNRELLAEAFRDALERVPLILRSEEHTSELQSRGHLVCRLLLEKKKIEELRPDAGAGDRRME